MIKILYHNPKMNEMSVWGTATDFNHPEGFYSNPRMDESFIENMIEKVKNSGVENLTMWKSLFADFERKFQEIDEIDLEFEKIDIQSDNIEEQLIKNVAQLIQQDLIDVGNLRTETLGLLSLLEIDNHLLTIQKLLKLESDNPLSLSTIVESFKKKYYTRDCFTYHSPDFCLIRAVGHDHRDIIERAIDLGAKRLYIPLAVAIRGNYREIVDLLIEKGADPIIGVIIASAYRNRELYDHLADLSLKIYNSEYDMVIQWFKNFRNEIYVMFNFYKVQKCLAVHPDCKLL